MIDESKHTNLPAFYFFIFIYLFIFFSTFDSCFWTNNRKVKARDPSFKRWCCQHTNIQLKIKEIKIPWDDRCHMLSEMKSHNHNWEEFTPHLHPRDSKASIFYSILKMACRTAGPEAEVTQPVKVRLERDIEWGEEGEEGGGFERMGDSSAQREVIQF